MLILFRRLNAELRLNKTFARCLCLLLTSLLLFCSSGTLQAQGGSSPEQTVQTNISITANANPTGVGQETWIHGSVDPPPPMYGDRLAGLTLSITKPDGTTDTLGPFLTESGLLCVSYVPLQVGNYRLQLDYSGQFFGSWSNTYLPTQSPAIKLTVQQDPVPSKTWTVDDNHPADFSSIQAAINASKAGDVVLVKTGHYFENINIMHSITLLGENTRETIIDGNNTGNVVTVNASNVIISQFTIQRSAASWLNGGVYLNNASLSCISGNIFIDNSNGIFLKSSSRNLVSANNITDGWYGIYLDSSLNNRILTNNIANCAYIGISTNFSSHNNTISRNTLTNDGSFGISILHSSNQTVDSNKITDNQFGVEIQSSSNNTVSNNILTNNSQCGISLHSQDNTIFANEITFNGHGIYLYSSSNNLISTNILGNKWNGIQFTSSSNNTISANTVAGNYRGIQFLSSSNNNEVSENRIMGNSLFGFYIDASSNNRIYHNDINNINQFYIINSTNTWDSGYASGGNYWSNYNGADANNDGIGDAPYAIDHNNQDNYPLMHPFTLNHNAPTTATINVQPNPVGVGQTVLIDMIITPSPPTSNDRFEDLALSITRPDGTVTTRSLFSDSGLLYIYYTPDMVGSHKIQLTYAGQFFSSRNITYLNAHSQVTTLNVQPQIRVRTWIVDDDLPADFHTIQEAIDAASSGDTVLVRNGTYQENPLVNKSLTLLGENAYQTTIRAKTAGKVVTVNASRVTIAGFTIQGSGGTLPQPYNIGVCFVGPITFCTVRNNVITGHGYGVSLRGSQHSVESNYVLDNTISGIYLNGSSNNAITSNNVTGVGKTGIFIAWPSSNNVLRNNNMTGENLNLHVISYDIPGFTNDIDTSNTVNGRPVYYWVGRVNHIVPSDAGAVALINCINITVQDLELSRTGQGILLAFTTGSTIQRNNITKCDNGIRVQSSSNNTLAGNNIYACTSGLSLYQSSNNTLRNNTVSDSLNNGVFVFLSQENRFSYNSFSNKKQLQIDNLVNYWDDGKEGNYWSDYAGTDANGDGIGDMPYSINANNTDRYPLVRTRANQSTNSSVVDRAGIYTQTESVSTYQSEASAPIEETTVIDEEPNSSDEGRKEPFTQLDQPLSAAIIPIALLLGTAVGIAFVAPLYLLRRKR